MAISRAEMLDKLVDRVNAAIEGGEKLPWQKPWNPDFGGHSAPHNPFAEKPYSPMNRLLLAMGALDGGYEDPRWMTYKQAKDVGFQVRRGEKAAAYIFAPVVKTLVDEKTGEEETRAVAYRGIAMFNAEQVDGIPPMERVPETERLPHSAELDAIAEQMGIKILHNGNSALYSPGDDRIQLPPRESFVDQYGYDATKAHELAHATGHSSRLDRDSLRQYLSIKGRAAEEMTAEIGAYLMSMDLGIPYSGTNPDLTEEQHAAYLVSWGKDLSPDERRNAIANGVRAASHLSDHLGKAQERGLVKVLPIEQAVKIGQSPQHLSDAEVKMKKVQILPNQMDLIPGDTLLFVEVNQPYLGVITDVLDTNSGGHRIDVILSADRRQLGGRYHAYPEDGEGMKIDNLIAVLRPETNGFDFYEDEKKTVFLDVEKAKEFGFDPDRLHEKLSAQRNILPIRTEKTSKTLQTALNDIVTPSLEQSVSPAMAARSVPDGLRRWMSNSQRLATEEGLRGEEKGFFQEKMQELESIIEQMPSTYQTQDFPDDQKPVGLRYFGPNGAQWFIIEKDRGDPETDGPNGPRQMQAFGLADLGMDYPELGYINIEEITKSPQVELDYHFTPTNLLEIKKEHYPEMVRRISMGESLVKEPPAPTPEELAWQGLRQQRAKMPHKMDMLFEDTRKAAAKLDILDEAGQIELRRQYSKKLEEISGIIREGPDRGADRHVLALVNAGVSSEGLYQRPEMQRYRAVCDEQGARASAFRKELDENLKDRFREYGKEILRAVDSHNEVVPTERQVAAVFWKHGIMASEGNQHVINFVRDVEEKNLPRLLSVIGHNSQNPASQEAFTRLTGVPLGKTQSERVAQLEKWAGPEVVAAMKAQQAERSAAKAQERIHKNLHSSFEHLDCLQVRINSKAHGPGNDVVVNGKDYLLIKVSQGMDRIVSEKRGAVTQYRLRAEDGTSSGVKSRELTDFAKAVLTVSPDGDVRQAFTTVGLPTPDKGLSDFLRERQEIWHGKHPDHQGFSNSVAGAEDCERRMVQENPAKAKAWAVELQKHSQMYGAISGLSQDSITNMAQRMSDMIESVPTVDVDLGLSTVEQASERQTEDVVAQPPSVRAEMPDRDLDDAEQIGFGW